jgi:uncharacterized phage protein gp47/JayE
MAFGLTPQGLIIKTMEDIELEIDETLRTLFGTNINTGVASVYGQLKNIMAEREALLWELAEAVYLSQYPNTASGSSLDNVCSISGVYRKAATKATSGKQAFTGVSGAIVPQGSLVSNSIDGSIQYITDAPLTINGPHNEKQLLTFDPIPTAGTYTLSFGGDTTLFTINYNASAGTVQSSLITLPSIDSCIVTGTYESGFLIEFDGTEGDIQQYPNKVTANTTGLFTVPSGPVRATTDIEQLGTATANGIITATAVNAGSGNFVAEGALTSIPTSITNITSTINLEDTLDGEDTESDSDLLLRRNQSLALPGGSTPAGLVSELNQIPEVESSFVVENEGAVVDGAGRQPHSFETYVYVPTIDISISNSSSKAIALREEIAQVIVQNKPGGIYSEGSILVVTKDATNADKNIRFTKPTPIPIWLHVMLQVDTNLYGSTTTGADTLSPVYSEKDTAINKDLVLYGQNIGPGKDVIVYPDLIKIIGKYTGIKDIRISIRTSAPTTGFPVEGDPAYPPPAVEDGNITIAPGNSSQDVQISQWQSNHVVVISQTGVLP